LARLTRRFSIDSGPNAIRYSQFLSRCYSVRDPLQGAYCVWLARRADGPAFASAGHPALTHNRVAQLGRGLSLRHRNLSHSPHPLPPTPHPCYRPPRIFAFAAPARPVRPSAAIPHAAPARPIWERDPHQ
jgi:hypothetical protein